MIIRNFVESDFDQILSLFFHTVRAINIRDYSDAQVKVWAPDQPDLNRWKKSFSEKIVYVAENKNKILGFGELEKNGHIDRFYIEKTHIGQGVGKSIYEVIEEKAYELKLCRLYVEASITARPFFTSMGFTQCYEQTVEVRGVQMNNFVMEKHLSEM